jgi:hypothetical protein
MTGSYRPESEQLVTTADDAEKATSTPEREEGGCHPARGLELSVGTVGSRGGSSTTDLEKAVRFAPGARDNGMTDVPGPTSAEPLVETSRIPASAVRSARSISGFEAAANAYGALGSGGLGLRVQ